MRERGKIAPSGAARDLSTPLVAALSLGPVPGDVRGNLRLAERELRAARRAHPELRCVVLPELFTCAYADLTSVHRHGEDAKGGSRPASSPGSRVSWTFTWPTASRRDASTAPPTA